MGDTKDKMTIKKNGANMILDAIKVGNKITVLYLKTKRCDPEGSSPQETNSNLKEKNNFKYGNDKKGDWQKKLGLTRETDINVVHRYSHLGEKFLRLTYDALDIQLTGTLQVCDFCASSKAKTRVFRKKTYTRASKPGERVFVDTTGTLPESLVGNRY